jgi:hypothetical protein
MDEVLPQRRHRPQRVPHNLNVSFNYVEGESLLMGIKDVAVSSGSACTSASLEPSYVLRALGRNDELAHSSIRFSSAASPPKRRSTSRSPRSPSDSGRQAARDEPAVGHGSRPASTSAHQWACALSAAGRTPTTTRRTTMAYSDKVIDHYENPRNVGALDKDDEDVGTGMVGAPACGDVMKLQIKVDPPTGVIEDAKFKTYGCGSAIASSARWSPNGSRARRSTRPGDQEHRDRRRTGAAAGEDPLLHPGRGRDQGRRRRLPLTPRPRRRQPHRRSSTARCPELPPPPA